MTFHFILSHYLDIIVDFDFMFFDQILKALQT